MGWAVGFIHCSPYSSSEVLQEAGPTPGRVQEVCGAAFQEVFGTINGSGCEGVGVVLAMRRGHPFQNPLVLHRATSTR